MKKSFFFVALAFCALAMTGCGDKSTPEQTPIKLWPAWSEDVQLYGFIDANGKWAIEPQFSSVSNYFSNGRALVSVGSRQVFINKRGRVLEADAFDSARPFRYGYSVAMLNGSYGLLNSNLSWTIQPAYSESLNLGPDAIATVNVGKKEGFLNTKGKFLTRDGAPMFFDDADVYVDGHVVVCDNTNERTESGDSRIPTYYLIDKSGNVAIADDQYREMESLGEDLVAARNKGKKDDRWSDNPWKIYDLSGNSVGSRSYGGVARFSCGLARVQSEDDNTFGYIDASGNEVIKPKYKYAGGFVSDYAVVTTDAGDQILIDKTGAVVIKLDEDEHFVTNAHNGLILIGVTNKKGETTYEWRNIESRSIVYSWSTKKGGSSVPSMPALQQEELGENFILD